MTPDTQGFWCPSLPWRDSIIFYNSYFRLVQMLYRRQHNFIDLKLNFRVNRATEIAYLELCFAREPDFHSEFQGAMFLTHQTCHSRNTKAVEMVQNTTSNPSNIQFLQNYHEDPFGDSSFIRIWVLSKAMRLHQSLSNLVKGDMERNHGLVTRHKTFHWSNSSCLVV